MVQLCSSPELTSTQLFQNKLPSTCKHKQTFPFGSVQNGTMQVVDSLFWNSCVGVSKSVSNVFRDNTGPVDDVKQGLNDDIAEHH